MIRRYKMLCMAFLIVVNTSIIMQGTKQNIRPSLTQIKQAIVEVNNASLSPRSRWSAADRLANLAQKIDPQEVDDKTLKDMVVLLSIKDVSIRASVAEALGFLGPRAISAAPELLDVLSTTICPAIMDGPTLRSAIRLALVRIGSNLPNPQACDLPLSIQTPRR